ncbi:hypothetical protein HALLA_12330 [Halostagnicola larsenii XH-48]|uniref:Uncharacterized protein n=1 Tax=Halostagnicola larsenii XH-48 TaxID=797299 RepID=W0JLI8_9EURY|nr:DUF6517 family protein [Halostagnicola larsenii]AHF99453.1 hypothetical protein HALLA_12330 [Halostagnicola larsenii XH-48]
MNRRAFIATAGVGGAGLTAGCIGNFLEDLTTYEAIPAEVSNAALEATRYEHDETDRWTDEESVATETVEVTSYANEYSRTIDLSILGLGEIEAGVFGAISTPQVDVAGESYNPVGEMEHDELLADLQDRYGELSIASDTEIDSRELEAVSQTVSVATFEGEATLEDDESVDVFVDISQPDHGDDHLIFAGVYPQDIPDEDDRIDTLIEGVEHEAE